MPIVRNNNYLRRLMRLGKRLPKKRGSVMGYARTNSEKVKSVKIAYRRDRLGRRWMILSPVR